MRFELACTTQDLQTAIDIALRIDGRFTFDRTGVSLRDWAFGEIAHKPDDPLLGASVARHIRDPVYRARTLSNLAGEVEDPGIGRQIVDMIDPEVTDAKGRSLWRLALDRIERPS